MLQMARVLPLLRWKCADHGVFAGVNFQLCCRCLLMGFPRLTKEGIARVPIEKDHVEVIAYKNEAMRENNILKIENRNWARISIFVF